MEPAILGETKSTVEENFDENKDLKVSTESAENFQKSIYELFNNNGILSDLRAYLRGHIVNTLKSAQIGSDPPINRNYKQRLELPNQALNILVAEYLVCMEFNYSLSVYVSELPLPNMIFEYAQDLLENVYDENKLLRFKEKDIWSVLTYLGVKCDSEYVSNMMEMYQSDLRAPLLMCMLKCLPMYKMKSSMYQIEDPPLSITPHSSETSAQVTPRSRSPNTKCRHYRKCRSCQHRFGKLKEKMGSRKRDFSQNIIKVETNNNAEKEMDNLMKNIDTVEGNLINEMFDQLKGVYETEVEMVKAEEEKKARVSLSNQALLLQKKEDELEEAYRLRAEELERSVHQKKQFLWSLAKSLRDQHRQMARAMQAVKCGSQRLTDKEENLKTQLLETEEILNRRGSEMREKISSELLLLESHVNSMKMERQSIDKEKNELQQLRSTFDLKINNSQEDFREQYQDLKKELTYLKKFITNRFDKCFVDECTNTENDKFEVLNNDNSERNLVRDERLIKGSNQLYNDFKKFKNVNFSFDQTDNYPGGLQISQAGDENEIEIARLKEENEKLERLATQQKQELEVIRDSNTLHSWPIRAAIRSNIHAQSRENRIPSRDSIPEYEVRGTNPKACPGTSKAGSHTRHLINQWRSLRPRLSPTSKLSKVTFTSPNRIQPQRERPKSANASLEGHQSRQENNVLRYQYTPSHTPPRMSTPVRYEDVRKRDMSPKSLLRQAKEKLRSKDQTKTCTTQKNRDKSPSSVLREAKQRLRKLEIEAEAVEKSYLDFRQRQAEIREGMCEKSDEGIVTKDVGSCEIKKTHSRILYESNHRSDAININREQAIKQDFDRYLISKFETSFNFNDRFKAQSSRATAKPIPEAYKENNEITDNLIDKPLSEFRKLYFNTNKTSNAIDKSIPVITLNNLNKRMNQLRNDLDFAKNLATTKVNEQSIEKHPKIIQLERQIHSQSSSPHEPVKLIQDNVRQVRQTDNLLRIEVETLSVNNLKESEDQDVFLVVQSAHSNVEKISETESECEQINTNMTILISPKRSKFTNGEHVNYKDEPDTFKRSPDSARTRNDAVFSDDKEKGDNNGESTSEVQKDLTVEYPDDFSADVEYSNNSATDQTPISHRKSSDDNDFWSQ